MRCHTGELGGMRFECCECGKDHTAGRSCGNRHCPNCQQGKTSQWLERQSKRLMPVHHFMITFTVPSELRPILQVHPKEGYNAIFRAARETLQELAKRRLGVASMGMLGVLHTWGRDPLTYHPHVHFIAPGGGVTADGMEWRSTPENFLFPKKDIARLYRDKFAEKMRDAELHHLVPAEAWRRTWVVDLEPVRDGRAALKYLAPYIYRVAISNKRIVACDEKQVRYEVTPTGQKKTIMRTVDGAQFVRGFIQHILPLRFAKVRNYGWMSQNTRTSVERVRQLVQLFANRLYPEETDDTDEAPESLSNDHRCPECGGVMIIVAYLDDDCSALVQHSQPFLDSG